MHTLIKIRFSGTCSILIENLKDPPTKWLARDIDLLHVDEILTVMLLNPNTFLHARPFLVVAEIPPEKFRERQHHKLHDVNVFLIGGRHRKVALEKVKCFSYVTVKHNKL